MRTMRRGSYSTLERRIYSEPVKGGRIKFGNELQGLGSEFDTSLQLNGRKDFSLYRR